MSARTSKQHRSLLFPLQSVGALLVAWAAGASSATTSVALASVQAIEQHERSISGVPFVEVDLSRNGAPPLRFYVSRPSAPAPLLLYVQGSGCAPAFIDMGGQTGSTVFSLLPTAATDKYAVMVVDKPLVPLARTASDGTAVDCPEDFNAYFSFATWSRDLRQAFDTARMLPWVAPERTLVLGMSEGAVMAADLAGAEPNVTDVAMLGATGPSQFFDFIAAAYRSGKTDAEVAADIDAFEATVRDIQADPDSATKFAWGHTYKRWSGFFAASSNRSLLNSRARMYLVSGMADKSVPILSTEALYSDLRAAGKDVTMRRVPDASHSLLPPGAHDYSQLNEEIQRVFKWFDRPR